MASAAAFLFSELADTAVYTPLARRRLISAVLASSLVGTIIDSTLFLWLAFGSVALLPQVVQRGPRPSARTAGTGLLLQVFARPEGWCVALPAGDRPELRVVAEVTRPIERPRAFRTAWPRFVPEGVPSRQLVVLPRALLDELTHDR